MKETKKPGIVTKIICFLAVFPADKYILLTSPVAKNRIFLNGLSAIISPSVFALALMTNKIISIKDIPYLMLLIPIVFLIDRYLIANSYSRGKK